jgi:Tol biopolymer transport system component
VLHGRAEQGIIMKISSVAVTFVAILVLAGCGKKDAQTSVPGQGSGQGQSGGQNAGVSGSQAAKYTIRETLLAPTDGRPVVLSADGSHYAYVEPRHANQRAVVDGKPGAEFDSVDLDGSAFTPDGQRFAYKAVKGGKPLVVVDGEAAAEFDGTGITNVPGNSKAFFFSPDGKRLAYVSGEAVVVDGKVGTAYSSIATSPIFSADSKSVAYVARKGSSNAVVVDGQPGPSYDKVDFLSFSRDGDHLAYAARTGTNESLVVDGRATPVDGSIIDARDGVFYASVSPGPIGRDRADYTPLGALALSPDGTRVAYVACKGFGLGIPAPTYAIVVDGKPGPWRDTSPSNLVFSPDGKRLAYAAGGHGKRWVVLDGKEGPEYDAIKQISPDGGFSPDGKRFAYVATSGQKSALVMDGLELGGWSAPAGMDGLFALGADGDWKYSVVVDGEGGPKYDELGVPGRSPHWDPIYALFFGGDGSLGCLEKKRSEEGSIYRVDFIPAN